jgi:hypothetical protein
MNTTEELFLVLDKGVKSNTIKMWITLVVSSLFIALPFVLDGDEPSPRGVLLVILASFFFVLSAYRLIFRKAAKEMGLLKNTILYNPKELVWSYIETSISKGITYTFVHICLREGKKIQISGDEIPNKDANGLLELLKRINPVMHVGYSKELEEKFKNKTL